LFDGQLDVLRVMIESPNNDHVFETPGDKEFAILEETEITGTQEAASVGICKMSLKNTIRLDRIVPIALRDTRA